MIKMKSVSQQTSFKIQEYNESVILCTGSLNNGPSGFISLLPLQIIFIARNNGLFKAGNHHRS